MTHNRVLTRTAAETTPEDLARQLQVTDGQVISSPEVSAWQAELEFITERSRHRSRGRNKERLWKREDLYEERLSRYAGLDAPLNYEETRRQSAEQAIG